RAARTASRISYFALAGYCPLRVGKVTLGGSDRGGHLILCVLSLVIDCCSLSIARVCARVRAGVRAPGVRGAAQDGEQGPDQEEEDVEHGRDEPDHADDAEDLGGVGVGMSTDVVTHAPFGADL